MEHSIFLEVAFPSKNYGLIYEAEGFKNLYTDLFARIISLSQGIISPEVASSGELVTNLTLQVEKGTEGLIACKIKSIAVPLLGDHVIREANHYIRLLNMFK